MFIKDPLIELLAIKLYEHDSIGGKSSKSPGEDRDCWKKVDEEDREFWRQMAKGEIILYDKDED